MSPLASEVVPNRALSANETRELIVKDFIRMLDNFSPFASMAAFGRLSWRLQLTLVTEANTHDTFLDSKPHAVNLIIGEGRNRQNIPAPEQYKNVEAHPLRSALARARSVSLVRNVTSPNSERLRAGLPVPVDVRQSDGQTRQETLQYAPDPEMVDNVTIQES